MREREPRQGPDGPAFDATAIERPDRSLLTYYVVVSLLCGPAFPFVMLPLWFKYHTLRYKIDAEGVSMAWGFLFRREILLTYRRIQDIHVRRNIVHRWLRLASVAVQTASGTAGAEMTIEGILQPEKLRDWLYAKMRGARGEDDDGDHEESGARGAEGAPAPGDEALVLLREIRDQLQRSHRGEEAAP